METYTKEHYDKIMSTLDPIGEFEGYSIKQGDNFSLGLLRGSKVRQCLAIVQNNLESIRKFHNGTIITGNGLGNVTGAIVAAVGQYFGLETLCVYPKYKDDKVDYDRINASLSQRYGAKVYGVGNPQPSGVGKDVKVLVEQTGAYEIKFGMVGDMAMQPVIYQVQNIPDYVKEITIIGGSGLSALSILRGLVKYNKTNVRQVNVIPLAPFFGQNKIKWYDPLPESEKFKGVLNIVPSAYPYRKKLKYKGDIAFDLTYESKAWDWLVQNREPSKEQLFWVVGIKNYDLGLIEKIHWHTSWYEKELNNMRAERALARAKLKQQ